MFKGEETCRVLRPRDPLSYYRFAQPRPHPSPGLKPKLQSCGAIGLCANSHRAAPALFPLSLASSLCGSLPRRVAAAKLSNLSGADSKNEASVAAATRRGRDPRPDQREGKREERRRSSMAIRAMRDRTARPEPGLEGVDRVLMPYILDYFLRGLQENRRDNIKSILPLRFSWSRREKNTNLGHYDFVDTLARRRDEDTISRSHNSSRGRGGVAPDMSIRL